MESFFGSWWTVYSFLEKAITNWQNILKRLPVNIHNFAHRYLIFNLANSSNLFCSKILPSSNRNLWLKPQTQLHIFNFCERTLDWFTRRYNSILSSLCNHLNKKVCPDFKIFTDLTNYQNPGNLFKSKRPAIIIKKTIVSLQLNLLVHLSWTLLNQGNTKKTNTEKLKRT